jgi:hypothetical protein
MNRDIEFKSRLEKLVGREATANIVEDSMQMAYAEAVQYGCNPHGTEKQLFFYRNLLDQVLTHYELR